MELSEFIKQSVREVIKGMLEAQTNTHKFGINNDNGNGIEFDVAVTTETTKGGGGKLSVLKVIDVNGKLEKSQSQIHRIKFTLIPRGKRNPK